MEPIQGLKFELSQQVLNELLLAKQAKHCEQAEIMEKDLPTIEELAKLIREGEGSQLRAKLDLTKTMRKYGGGDIDDGDIVQKFRRQLHYHHAEASRCLFKATHLPKEPQLLTETEVNALLT